MSEETWRAIPGWVNYQVSNLGRVRRLACKGTGGRKLQERYLTIVCSHRSAQKYKYLSVTLGNALNMKSYSVARLVLLAFVGAPAPGQECRHLNDVSTDCRLVNLAWGSRTENRADAIRNRRLATGERNGGAKLTEQEVAEIRALFRKNDHYNGAAALARKYNVRAGAVLDIAHNRTWRT